jgi:hypothetical protein
MPRQNKRARPNPSGEEEGVELDGAPEGVEKVEVAPGANGAAADESMADVQEEQAVKAPEVPAPEVQAPGAAGGVVTAVGEAKDAAATAAPAKPEAIAEAKEVEVKKEGTAQQEKVKVEGESDKKEVKVEKKEAEVKTEPKPRVTPDALKSDKILGALLPFVRDPSMATVSKLWADVVRNSVAFWGVVSGRGKRTNDTTIAALAANKGWIIRTFDLEDCKHIGDNALRAIAKVEQLEGVNLIRCMKITDDAIIDMAKQSPTLRMLSVAFCQKLQDVSILVVADQCPNLEVLNLDCCTNITDECIMAIADKCPKLKSLGVGNCSGVTDKSILKIIANCPNMENLNISCTPQNDASVIAIAKACPKLKR